MTGLVWATQVGGNHHYSNRGACPVADAAAVINPIRQMRGGALGWRGLICKPSAVSKFARPQRLSS